jgi:uncharacterized membrane protein
MEQLLYAFGRDTGIHVLMNSAWGWPIAESVHFLGLSLLIGCIGTFDLRILGVGHDIPLLALHRLIPWGVAGYSLNVATGLLFLTSAPDQYLYNPAFQVKLALMLVAGLNVVFFYAFVFTRVQRTGPREAVPGTAKLAAAVSLACWVGVIVCGRLITYYRPPYHWCFWC